MKKRKIRRKTVTTNKQKAAQNIILRFLTLIVLSEEDKSILCDKQNAAETGKARIQSKIKNI